jgi:hypothetical protein
MLREILTRCGYRCDLCLAYKENILIDDRRRLLSDGWYKFFGFRIEPEDIYCDGCLNDDCLTAKLLDTGCPIRPCVKEKGYENCSHCDDFMCSKFKERLVDYEEIKEKNQSISKSDYKLFICPYENGKRIRELKEKNGDFTRMFNKEIMPTVDDMSKFIGNECCDIWSKLIVHIRNNYKVIENIVFGGKNYGWALQYKQNKSTTLFTLFPERKAFTALIIYGKKELDNIEENKGKLSPEAYELIKNTHQFHDGKWVWLKMKNDTFLKDLYALLEFKKKPNKA